VLKLIAYLSLIIINFVVLGCAAVVVGAVAAGAGTVAAVATDPRTNGTIIDDNANELKLRRQYATYNQSNIYVQVYNGSVLLTGQVANSALKESATQTAKLLPGISKIYNYLDIGAPQSISSKTTDTYTTTQVRTKILKLKDIHNSSFKVITTNNVVYLIGIVTQHQATEIAQITATIGGVTKVITLFDYVNSAS
jgi:osmotically-inducible protein OsmY